MMLLAETYSKKEHPTFTHSHFCVLRILCFVWRNHRLCLFHWITHTVRRTIPRCRFSRGAILCLDGGCCFSGLRSFCCWWPPFACACTTWIYPLTAIVMMRGCTGSRCA